MNTEITVLTVFIAALITALCTGLGAVPFFFIKNIGRSFLGAANALAAGLMLGASIGLTIEGGRISVPRLIIGLVLGLVLILVTRRIMEGREHPEVSELSGANTTQMLLIMVVMTVMNVLMIMVVSVAVPMGTPMMSSMWVIVQNLHNDEVADQPEYASQKHEERFVNYLLVYHP